MVLVTRMELAPSISAFAQPDKKRPLPRWIALTTTNVVFFFKIVFLFITHWLMDISFFYLSLLWLKSCCRKCTMHWTLLIHMHPILKSKFCIFWSVFLCILDRLSVCLYVSLSVCLSICFSFSLPEYLSCLLKRHIREVGVIACLVITEHVQ